MDPNNFNHPSGTGPRMPSPMVHGQTVREIEEQMSALRKENFNLRLRLYFMEESMPASKVSSSGDSKSKEAIGKQLVDAKIEIEKFRKELQQKEEILKEAGEAMTQMDAMQKDKEAKSSAEIGNLRERIKYLEKKAQGGGHVSQRNASICICGEVEASVPTQAELTSGDVEQMSHSLVLARQENERFVQKLQELETKLVEHEEKIRQQAIESAELLDAFQNKTDQVCSAFKSAAKSNPSSQE